DAGRILMRGSDIGETRAVGSANAGLDTEALLVHRHGNGMGVGEIERGARAEIAWVLDPGGVASIEEKGGDREDGLLRAVEDDDLLGRARESAKGAKVTRQGLAQGE